jgi:hypothetical protein
MMSARSMLSPIAVSRFGHIQDVGGWNGNGRSLDDGNITFDANGIGRDSSGAVVAANPLNQNVQRQMATTTDDHKDVNPHEFQQAVTGIHSVIDDISATFFPPSPAAAAVTPAAPPSHRNLILGLLVAAAVVFVVRHKG